MKLFSFFKKPKEVIKLNIPEVSIQKSQIVAKDEDIYFERAEFKEEYSISEIEGTDAKKDNLHKRNEEFEKKVLDLYHTFSFLRLFAKAANKDNNYNENLIALEKQINHLKKKHEEYKRRSELVKYIDFNDGELEQINSQLNSLFNFYEDLNKKLRDFQNKYYKHLKMTSYSICSEKSYLELENINKNINNILADYKNINEAYDYIYYNSGGLIVDTVKSFVECLERSTNPNLKKDYNFYYFLPTDYVVAFSFPEWVELFTKMKYVMKIAKVELFDYLKFKKLYHELETRYIIMLIYNEMIK